MDQLTVATVSGLNHLAIITASDQRGFEIEPQPALLLFWPVALDTVFGKERAHVATEIHFFAGRSCQHNRTPCHYQSYGRRREPNE